MQINRNQQILMEMVENYKKLKEVDSIGLGGSSTAKMADNKSDYDIYIYGKNEPPVEDRRKIAEKFADNPEVDNHYFETGDTFRLRETGKPIDIMYRDPEFIENNIKWVWEGCNASLGYTTCFVDNIKKTEILYDKNGWLKSVKERVSTPYPDKLAQNIITKNFTYLKDAMFSFRDQIASAVERADFVSINHRCAAFLASYFDTIFAKNKVLNPGEKKLIPFALNNCKILPKDFEHDVKTLAVGDIAKRLPTADKMVENLRKIL